MKAAKRYGTSGTAAGLYLPPKLRAAIAAKNPLRKQAVEKAARLPPSRPRLPRPKYDRRWRAFIRGFLSLPENLWCRDCLPTLTPATEGHHIAKVEDAPERRLDPDNILPLCKSCHAKRTLRGE